MSASQSQEMVTHSSGARYPKSIEPLTENEHALLDTYELIKHYEKEAQRLKAEEAKRRLEEANERYQAKVRERERAEGRQNDDENEAKEPSKRVDEETVARRKKKAEEIARLRKDVSAAQEAKSQQQAEKQAARRKEEDMRRQLLGEPKKDIDSKRKHEEEEDDSNTEDEDPVTQTFNGPSIKKKQRIDDSWDQKPKPSLISNLTGNTTPVHDFSKDLGMSKGSLDGEVLYPGEGDVVPWEPPQKPMNFLDGCLQLELPDFDSSLVSSGSGNNTVAIKFHAPNESSRFSINIAAQNNDNFNDILLHFNPRHFQRGGQLVINDRKETRWGNDLSVPLSQLPLMFGAQSTLIIQINSEGFDLFMQSEGNRVHCARLEHRADLPEGKVSLMLQFPSSDDYGNPENWQVFRVWWGRKPIMAGDISGVAGANTYDSVHKKKLFISGLSKLHTDPEVDLRRAELERAFRKYGGRQGLVTVSVQKNSTFAFVEVATEQQADLALLEMKDRYKLNKARRTKHEALIEKRAAEEAAASGKVTDTIDWD